MKMRRRNPSDLERALEGDMNLAGASLRRADLSGASLRRADLSGANLEGANLEGANLMGANLKNANLAGANLTGVNLKGAYLLDANLKGANLKGADLKSTNLEGAELEGANLEGADLERANLFIANLREANLEGANLEGANLRATDLEGANVKGTILETPLPRSRRETGTFAPADASILRNPIDTRYEEYASEKARKYAALYRSQHIDQQAAAAGVSLEMSLGEGNIVFLDHLVAAQMRAGAGSKLMHALTELADEVGVTLMLTAQPIGGRIPLSRLVAFYEGFGFVENMQEDEDDDTGAGVSMVRKPERPNGGPSRGNPHRRNPAEPRYTLLGVDEEVTTCEHCGKADLKCTVVLGALDADGNVEREARFGRSCAAKALRKPSTTTANKMESLARVAEFKRVWAMRVDGPGKREQVRAGRFPTYVTSYPLTDGRTLLVQESDPSFRPPAGAWTRLREGAWVGHPAKTNPSRSRARR